MNISEDTFTLWSKGPSDTETAKCENAETAVRKAINADSDLQNLDISVFAQGSYRARTNSAECQAMAEWRDFRREIRQPGREHTVLGKTHGERGGVAHGGRLHGCFQRGKGGRGLPRLAGYGLRLRHRISGLRRCIAGLRVATKLSASAGDAVLAAAFAQLAQVAEHARAARLPFLPPARKIPDPIPDNGAQRAN